ncbi:SICAvar, type I [Plasmodium knowlesi strain H]|uniref:SICAvar, type I n=3 Tax=Plasmodium knowlesi TaxID=5850 RepID=A0A5K1UWU9_PLAKH|nr:SICAvar, type I [Plasmodium knowlesi strain H]OTN64078.1 SICAvar type I [Plasmodium knowlesi]CAA9990874.1 SICAvar, type I [Plasmodium knowlesi strain H]SBO20902.1 SICAvar, type I [Plasmodium knowlesi strain H]SBO21383.1 SICAvar, type I [Plasmodium knowlesi strain H]VVS80348.1 SICAvar, type I [Plasmodium knowlesi strain H]
MADPSAATTQGDGGLLGEWMKTILNNSGKTSLTTPQEITEVMRKDFEDAWEKLQESLMLPEVNEMADLCKGVVDYGSVKERSWEEQYLKELCKAVVELRYFTSGGGTQKRRRLNFDRNIKPHEWYPRCVVGAVALTEIYGDHCYLREVLHHISDKVEQKLRDTHQSKGAKLDVCSRITDIDLMVGRAVLGNRMKQWAQEEREKGGASRGTRGSGRVGIQWWRWKKVCPEGRENATTDQIDKAKKNAKEANKNILTSFVKVGPQSTTPGTTTTSTTPTPGQTSTLGDVLVNEDLTIAKEVIEEALSEIVSSGKVDTNRINDVVKKLGEASQQVKAQECIKGHKDQKDKLCDRLKCMKYLWQNIPTGEQGTIEDFWTGEDGVVKKLWNELAQKMKATNGTGNTDCDKMPNATNSEKAACNYLHAGFKQLYEPEASSSPPSGGGDDILSKKYPSFRQTMGCLLLHSYAKYMKEKAICNIEKGITQAFELGDKLRKSGTNCNGSATGKGPCVPCQWNDASIDNCTVQIGTDGTGTTEDGMKKIIEQNNSNTKSIIDGINKMETLCNRLQCIASHLNSTDGQKPSITSAKNFWTKTGDVGKLWTELSNAMKNNGNNAGDCGQMEDGTTGSTGTRDATNPERKACQHLTAGFDKLKSIATSSGNDYPILSKDPSLKQAMGCFLLKEYAKHMQGQSKCVIESGIKKAFNSWGSITKGNCTGDSPCIECKWDDDKLGSCGVKIGTNGTEMKDKVNTFLQQNNNEMDATMKDINDMSTLCDYIKCAAPKWFQNQNNQAGSGTTPTKNWCDFWNDGVKPKLEEMFKQIEKNGMDKSMQTNGPCDQFGDDNPDSVERKACNHITAGLDYIKDITGDTNSGAQAQTSSSQKDDKFFKQSIMCAALNLYATKIKEMSQDKCPIDENTIQRMFEAGNGSNTSSSTSCLTSGGNKNDCFVCERKPNFNSCELSVPNTLINTQPNGTCTDKDNDKHKVQPEMTKLLEDKTTIKMEDKLSQITNINTSFCTQLQCTAKKWNFIKKKNGKPTWTKFWESGGEVAKLWEELAGAMMERSGNGQCDKVDGTRQATEPERKACEHLTAVFDKLKSIATSDGNKYTILKDNPSLKQAIGCLLLKEYAKQMEKKTTCLIESGIKKAFEVGGKCTSSNGSCIKCKWDDKVDNCNVTIDKISVTVKTKVEPILKVDEQNIEIVTENMNEMTTLCQQLQCAAPNWFKKHNNNQSGSGSPTKTWCEFWDMAVKEELQKMFADIEDKGKNTNPACNEFGDDNPDSVERKACNHIAAGLQHLKTVSGNDQLFERTVGCIALNMYATKIREASEDKCPIDEDKIKQMFSDSNKNINSSCSIFGGTNKDCFLCTRKNEDFKKCELSVSNTLINTPSNGSCTLNTDKDKVHTQMNNLLEKDTTIKMKPTLDKINEMNHFCTKLQCAAKQYYAKKHGGKSSGVNWDALEKDIGRELNELLEYMTKGQSQPNLLTYCNDDAKWDALGHKKSKTNKAACLLFAAGLQHIYSPKKVHVKGPSFEQTMGCLFLKEYAKQLKDLANKKKKGYSWVHPLCEIDKGIDHAFNQSKDIMEKETPLCKGTNVPNSCFVCTQEEDYNKCKIGDDKIEDEVKPLLQSKETHMEKTLENTVCPILLTDLLTPFLPLAPVSIGLSAMAYYLWKYFGPLGKGGARFRRSPAQASRPSVQEQLLDHADEGASHEYRLVKERKPRSAPTRTKRSGRDPAGGGRVNRRTIIEIHFEVLDECQKGDTQLNQKDFLELLVREFMGSELMEEEQVPKEDVLMEGVPMEGVPMEGVPMEGVPIELVLIEEIPSLGSGLLV